MNILETTHIEINNQENYEKFRLEAYNYALKEIEKVDDKLSIERHQIEKFNDRHHHVKMTKDDIHQIDFKNKYGEKKTGFIYRISIEQEYAIKASKHMMFIHVKSFDDKEMDFCDYIKTYTNMPKELRKATRHLRKAMKGFPIV